MKVIRITEECHGTIGLAKNMQSAFDFLLENDWLNEYTTVGKYNEETEKFDSDSIVVFFPEVKDMNKDEFINWCIGQGEDFWDGVFYFHEEEIWEKS